MCGVGVWQVLSDSNITPLLTMLGAANEASRRPVWGSTLVFELWQGPRAEGTGKTEENNNDRLNRLSCVAECCLALPLVYYSLLGRLVVVS